MTDQELNESVKKSLEALKARIHRELHWSEESVLWKWLHQK